MAFWSPRKSEPLIVSKACHFQSSIVWLPSAAFMPPEAATVCDLVGNNFDTQATFFPFSHRPNAALKPAPPPPIMTESYMWSIIWKFLYVNYLTRLLFRN